MAAHLALSNMFLQSQENNKGGYIMDTKQIVDIISTVGFPIVCCYFMWRYINTTLKEFSDSMKKNNETIANLCSKIDIIILRMVGGDPDDHVEN